MSNVDPHFSTVEDILNLTTGVVSAVAGLWLFHFYRKTPRPRSVSLRVILFLSIADFGYSIANLLSAFDARIVGLCVFEGWLRLFSMTSGLYWACCVAVLSYLTFSAGMGLQQESFFKKALALSLVVPTVYSIMPFIIPQYHYSTVNYGCYVTLANPNQSTNINLDKLLIIIIFAGIPVLISLVLSLVLYSLIVKKVKELSSMFTIANDINVGKLYWFPAVLFIAYIPSVADNIIEIYMQSESIAFTSVHIILTHTVGFTNTLVYGLQRKKFYENSNSLMNKEEKSVAMTTPNRNKTDRNESIDNDASCEGLRYYKNSSDDVLKEAMQFDNI